jgi:hypothetical protein
MKVSMSRMLGMGSQDNNVDSLCSNDITEKDLLDIRWLDSLRLAEGSWIPKC